MGEAYSMHGRDKIYMYKILVGNPEEKRNYLKFLGLDEVVLKLS
jgi:hypothetical protein